MSCFKEMWMIILKENWMGILQFLNPVRYAGKKQKKQKLGINP